MTTICNDPPMGSTALREDDQQMRELEHILAPMVRLALGNGVGLPEVVQWVQQTYATMTEGATPALPEFYVPQITRLLCAQWH